MKIINHQLINEPFFIPDWDVKHLLIGTFNPEGGEPVNYYYGRPKNQTWNLLSKIFHCDFNPNSQDFFALLRKNKIACVDMINQLKASVNRVDRIIGKGYKDTEIINGSVERLYNTVAIKEIIEKNENIKVYTTWGNGSNLKEWRDETAKLGGIIKLKSPSLAAAVPKGSIKFDYMLDDWSGKISSNLISLRRNYSPPKTPNVTIV
jgi:hypothetical protein